MQFILISITFSLLPTLYITFIQMCRDRCICSSEASLKLVRTFPLEIAFCQNTVTKPAKYQQYISFKCTDLGFCKVKGAWNFKILVEKISIYLFIQCKNMASMLIKGGYWGVSRWVVWVFFTWTSRRNKSKLKR